MVAIVARRSFALSLASSLCILAGSAEIRALEPTSPAAAARPAAGPGTAMPVIAIVARRSFVVSAASYLRFPTRSAEIRTMKPASHRDQLAEISLQNAPYTTQSWTPAPSQEDDHDRHCARRSFATPAASSLCIPEGSAEIRTLRPTSPAAAA